MEQSLISNPKRLNIVLNIILGVLIIGLFMVGIYVKSDVVLINTDRTNYISGKWTDAITGEFLEGSTIDIEPGDCIVIEKPLRKELTDDYMFFFYDPGFVISVYIEGEKIASLGRENNKTVGNEIGTVWRQIPLDEELEGKVITLAFYNDTDTIMTLNTEKMYCGTESFLCGIVIGNELLEVLIFLLSNFTTIFLLILAGVLKHNKFDLYTKRLITLAVFCYFVGLWVIADGNVLQLVFANGSIRYMLDKFALFLLPLIMNHYFELVVDRNAELYRIFAMVYKVLAIICLLIYRLHLVHISQTIFLVHAFLIMEALMLGYTSIQEYKEKRDLDSLGMVVSAPVIAGFIGTAIYAYYFLSTKIKITGIIGIGYAILILILFATQVKQILELYKERERAKEYESMISAIKDFDFNIEESLGEDNEDI